MFSKRRIERLAGVLLVASVVAILGHLVAVIPAGLPPVSTDRIRGLLEWAAQARGTLLVAFTLFLLTYGFLVFLCAVALYRAFHSHENTLAPFSAFALAAHGLLIVLFNTEFLVLLESAEEFAVASGAEADAVLAVASALWVSLFRIQGAAWIFLGLGVLALGVLIVWSRVVSRWVGWVGLVGGILGFLSGWAKLVQVAVGSPASRILSTFFMTVFVTPLVFMLILGVWLLVWETRDATDTVRPDAIR